ncbi:anti-sigma factor family protein [Mycolicibacterium sp.]|uniref:anti-sigma factor n=1 Tax=Mycolicibacterium sp. TaxID=2320850 RepID=UPI003D09EE27
MTADGNIADWEAAYLFGALTEAERWEFEQFLASEPACAAALQEFAAIPALLNALPYEDAIALIDERPRVTETTPNAPATTTITMECPRTWSVRTKWTAGLVSAAALMAVGGAVGYIALPEVPVPEVALKAMAPGVREGISASLSIAERHWGTRLDWECRYTKPWATAVTTYNLVLTTNAGEEVSVASWAPGEDPGTDLAAATRIPVSQIHTIEIRAAGSRLPLAVTTLR